MKKILLLLAILFVGTLFIKPKHVWAATVRCQYDSSIDICRVVGSCPSGTNYDSNECPANCAVDKDITCKSGAAPPPATDCKSISGGHCVMQSQGCSGTETGKATTECGNFAGGWMCCIPAPAGQPSVCPGGYCTVNPNTSSGGAKKVCDFIPGDPNDPNSQRGKCDRCFDPQDGSSSGSWTAIGCIKTDPTEFIKSFLTFGIGIAGGLAFLLILLGGFQILTSAGNPEQLNAGRELVGAAVSGLLMIIFSLFLLRAIGADILGIPGFG